MLECRPEIPCVAMKNPFVTLLSFACVLFLPGMGMKTSFAQQGDVLPLDSAVAPVDCTAMHAPTACTSFNEMLKDGKFQSILENKRVKTWVCFRLQQNSFVMLNFYLPRYWATDNEETSRVQNAMADKPRENPNHRYLRGQVTSAPFVFREFTNKDQATIAKGMLEWKKASDQDDSAATGLSKSPDISVSPAAISISAFKVDSVGSDVAYSIMIDSTKKTFSEFTQQIGKPATEEKGFCTQF